MTHKKTTGSRTYSGGDNEMFLKRALEKILSEKDIKRTQHAQLKKACETALSEVTKEIQNTRVNESSVLPSITVQQSNVNAEKYFLPFELACASNHPRMVETSLDCLQKLLLHGHLMGTIPDPMDVSKLLIDRIVSTICLCFRGVQTEEQVELQIIKALLTIMTSQTIEIHQRSVLQIIKTCFNIYLTSRSKINEATAQGSLSQMLNGIFSKMEQKLSLLNERRRQLDSRSTSQQRQRQEPLDDNTTISDISLSTMKTNEEEIISESIINEDEILVKDILDELVEKICYDEATQQQRSTNLTTNEIIEEAHSLHEDILTTIPSTTALSYQSNGETETTISTSLSSDELSADNYFKNAFYVFRALCKLSDRDIKDKTNTDPRTNLDLKSRIFSLRLIMQILQTSGPTFRTSEDFLNVIKTYLCVSLSRNGVSAIPELFEMALYNFVELLDKFKQHLKVQIEVLFREIFLTILETTTSSFRHKWLVIQTLAKISADAQIIVDLFINYDCSMRSANIFERLVIVLSRAAQGRQAVELGCSQIEEHNLRMKGLECLVSILRCMVDWSKDLYVNPHLQSNLGPDTKPLNENGDHDSGRSSSGVDGSMKRTDSVGSINSSHSNSGLSSESWKNPGDYEAVRQRKELFEKGCDIFNQDPKKGLQFLIDKNLVHQEAEDVAQFFHSYQDVLDKTVIGDFLGESTKYHKEVMYVYIDQLDFNKMDFLAALRKFLAGFRLPGEAQKIDRLMEKFAARYCECNSNLGIFASADAAYVLAYSVIMLTTDLHSKNVKKKMTKEQYIKMNRGINESRDLPEEFLSKIYDEIENEEIKLKITTAGLRRGAGVSGTSVGISGKPESITSDKQRQLLFNIQMKDVEVIARDLMSNAGTIRELFTIAKHLEHVRPMFQKAWSPCLAAFSVGLQDTDNIDLAMLCLTGLSYAIRIACIFRMELERNAFVQALSRFTLLTATSQVTEIKAKNVECLKTLITVAQTDGNYLGEAWYEILKCISQLELAQLFGVNAQKSRMPVTNHHHYPSQLSNSTATFNLPFDNLFYSDKNPHNKRLHPLNEQIQETSSQSIVVSVDRIFSGSARLDGDAIVAFVRSLCHVSMDELYSSTPRMFSLLKVVEISYYNMGRIRLQWSRIWEIVGEHFNKVACNPLQDVAFFAVDSLRQLSMKFLEKGEFLNFRFQKEFLKPFEHIMKKNSSSTIHDMVVRCVTHLVDSQAKNIKSGWKNIFSVFQMAAADTDASIVELAFQTCTHIITTVFDRHFASVLDSFQDAVKCLSEFACNASFPDTSMEAIRLIRQCAKYVAEKPHMFNEHAGEDLINVPEEDRVWVKGWFPVLFELSCIINRCKLDVRTRALTVMFEIMKYYGETFTQNWWKELFNVVFRIFDNMKLPDTQIEKIEWMTTTCNHALYAIVDVFTQFFDDMADSLVEDLYSQLKWCVNQDNEQLAKSGINCLENFVIACGQRFTPQIWERTCACILEIFRSTLPEALMTWRPDTDSSTMTTIIETSMLDRTYSSFDHAAVESASSQHNRLKHGGSVASLNSSTSTEGGEQELRQRYSSSGSSERTRPNSDYRLFQILTIKCVVQLELIQAIDNIVFYPSTSKKEDLQNIAVAQALASCIPGQHNQFTLSDESRDDQGMYQYMSIDQLLLLVDCLIESHIFARTFNSNHEQRNLLWKSGYRGKAKPNLLIQETHSIACAFRILFRLYNNTSRRECWDTLRRRIIRLTRDTLEYYLTLQSESHRDAWTSVLLLLYSKLLKLDDERFKFYGSDIYLLVSEVIVFDLKPELRYMTREFLFRIGNIFNINNTSSRQLQIA